MPGPQRVKIDDLELDATPEQEYSGDVETTDNPVEDGADVTDHAREKPETFTATAIVSSVPVDESQRNARGAFERFASGGYARSVYQQMQRMKSERKLHTIVTPLRRYSNMLLTNLGVPTRANLGDAVQFKIAFKQIRVVESGTAELARPAAVGTNKPVDKKQQAKKPGTPADRKTILKQFTDSVGLTTPGSGVAPP